MRVVGLLGASGQPMLHHYMVDTPEALYLKYDGIFVAKQTIEGVTLDAKYWKAQDKEGRCLPQFLGEDMKSISLKVADGFYQLEDLN